MLKFITAVLIIVLFFSCASKESNKDNGRTDKPDSLAYSKSDSLYGGSAAYYKMAGDSLIFPSFAIEIALSQKANEKLTSNKETIIIAAWFSGQPKDTTTREYAESGEMFIKSAKIELNNNRLANFEGIKFSKASYDSLADKDIRVLINIFSGRRSTPDNLLDCTILSDKMSAVREQKFTLKGKLIGEIDSSTSK
ncbi:MAG: hypothetical protein ABIR15_06210 [Chitinophagaceae bacterium]